ncbi:sigma-54-dependent Fis family transcriptional regulator [Paraburkholderia panacisoli]|uniref:Sigma-54-dependent Fis family transcriptional regulator n=1 Tax=Paraburkholderia panacisoli TaxID=2603818 RepID=A0A5B0HGM9_9BURK|nr:sigma-54-dependent Fis family transcriptional regulator [Paraburkholderia panacisoli]KAA1014220.1 sigma-54-dependent Fis family transcriptional regulator [Paraburkholderia panacisoli]
MRPHIDPEDRILRARREFFETGSVSEQKVSALLLRSWERSRGHGLQASSRLLRDAVRSSAPLDIEEANAQLIGHSRSEMERLHHAFSGENWLVALVNAEGVVVRSVGGQHATTRKLVSVLHPGADVSEKTIGTNGPGSALVERRPILIRGREHFLDEAAEFACAAVPLADPFGALAGALDISYLCTALQVDPLLLLATAAREIENQMIDSLHDINVVRFHYRADMLRTPYAALLAVSHDGYVVGANRDARATLRLGDSTFEQLEFSSLFDLSLPQLIDASRLSTPALLHRHSGVRLYASASEYRGKEPQYVASAHRGAGVGSAAGVARSASRAATHRSTASALARPSDEPYLMADSRLEASFEKARRAFDRDIPVIVYGETGTGKEVVAQRLHAGGPRRSGSLVAINCFALPASLVESELFGYEHGAFTGGRRGGAPGKFEEAHNGTLFLDEIGDMPFEIQGRLLRVLQERKVTRLGSSRETAVNISLICATHRSLPGLVAEGKFREDLFYRLSGVSITLPPLRERSDLRQLIDWLLARESLGAFAEHAPYRLDNDALDTLLNYRWPGNVRELRSVLRAAAALGDPDGKIRAEHLPLELVKQVDTAHVNTPSSSCTPGTLAAMETDAIRQALEHHHGNIAATARSLGIGRATLHRKLHKM